VLLAKLEIFLLNLVSVMNKKLILLVFICLTSFIGYSQTPIDYSESINLHTVYAISPSFPNTDGWIRILKDNGSPLSGSKNTTIWTNEGSVIKPAAYESDYAGYFGADFKVTCENTDIWVRGETTDGYHLPIQKLEAFGNFWRYKRKPLSSYSGGTYTELKFVDEQVKYWQNFEIKWYMSPDENLPLADWQLLNDSSFPLYVTHDTPLEGLNANDANQLYGTQILHTVLNLSCRGANGQSVENTIMSNIFPIFESLCVKQVNDKGEDSGGCLGYWADNNSTPNCSSVSEFLTEGDAKCAEWAHFYNDMIRVQGINSSRLAIVTFETQADILAAMDQDLAPFFGNCDPQLPISVGAPGFFVNEYSFTPSTNFFLNNQSAVNNISLCNGNQIENLDVIGVEGQGKDDPNSSFVDHGIVLANSVYYDPSYGFSRPSKSTWEDKALAGYGVDFTMTYINSNDQPEMNNIFYLYEIDIEGSSNLQSTINP